MSHSLSRESSSLRPSRLGRLCRLFGQYPRPPHRRCPELESLESRIVPTAPVVSVLAPPANSNTVPISAALQATFDQPLNPATVTDQTLVVHATQSPRLRT